METKTLQKFTEVLGKRVYRPIKPLINPLLKKIKLVHWLVGLIILAIIGSVYLGWQLKPQEKAAWWPWASKAHAEMSLAWFDNGNEKKARDELLLANKLMWIKSLEGVSLLNGAEIKVKEPERIRKEVEQWEKEVEQKPYYRDALLKLSMLNYQLYEDEKAKEYFKKAFYLDPTGEEVLKIKNYWESAGWF